MSGIKRETIIRVILGICMIVVSIGMIYGKSKAGNANGNDRTYIEESEKNAKSWRLAMSILFRLSVLSCSVGIK